MPADGAPFRCFDQLTRGWDTRIRWRCYGRGGFKIVGGRVVLGGSLRCEARAPRTCGHSGTECWVHWLFSDSLRPLETFLKRAGELNGRNSSPANVSEPEGPSSLRMR